MAERGGETVRRRRGVRVTCHTVEQSSAFEVLERRECHGGRVLAFCTVGSEALGSIEHEEAPEKRFLASSASASRFQIMTVVMKYAG